MYNSQKYHTPTGMGPCIDDSVWTENPYLDDAVTEECSCINNKTQAILFIHIYTSASIINVVNSMKKNINCNYDYLCYCRQLTNLDCKDLFLFSFLRSIYTNLYLGHCVIYI